MNEPREPPKDLLNLGHFDERNTRHEGTKVKLITNIIRASLRKCRKNEKNQDWRPHLSLHGSTPLTYTVFSGTEEQFRSSVPSSDHQVRVYPIR